ncbi:hypothetical protein OSTOST_23116 [Ostertagia ostertagi]
MPFGQITSLGSGRKAAGSVTCHCSLCGLGNLVMLARLLSTKHLLIDQSLISTRISTQQLGPSLLCYWDSKRVTWTPS